ncbi:MAG: hypothetical protein ACUBOA_02920 [Candidatus Loosdrechtia sp.]|uniref:hypothetical protein n=1 Tax=Candidatus Loosdrechtia sp. TaxID=3101272 RepID=UPI003A666786|nr:MAG: hypothetical protein QY305_02305 [Candidatus Jettenia sp. AMX2]
MSKLSNDIHPEAERIHIELIRKASVNQRLQMVTSLVKTMRLLSWQGICERYPNETWRDAWNTFFFNGHREIVCFLR